MEYYSTIKQNKMPFTAIWMDLQIIILSEISKIRRDNHHMI